MRVLQDSETFNINFGLRIDELATKILDGRDGRLLAAIDVLSKTFDMRIVDPIQNFLDGLIDNGRVLDGCWALQDTGSAHILVNDSLEILRLPQRIFLEVEFEIFV